MIKSILDLEKCFRNLSIHRPYFMTEDSEVQEKFSISEEWQFIQWQLLLSFSGRDRIRNQVARFPVHSLLFLKLTSSFHLEWIYLLLQHISKIYVYIYSNIVD